jgi:hypothetical protein
MKRVLGFTSTRHTQERQDDDDAEEGEGFFEGG